MIVLIIVYWDDVGGFNLYPLQDQKHKTLHSGCCTQRTPGPSPSVSTGRTQTGPVSTPGSGPTLIPTRKTQKHAEKAQRKDKTKEREEKEMSHSSVDDREQQARKQMITDVCSRKDAMEFPGKTRAFEQIPIRELDHLIVDDTHQIIYCYVPKVRLRRVCVSVFV